MCALCARAAAGSRKRPADRLALPIMLRSWLQQGARHGFQPSPRLPTIQSSGVRASSRKTSANSESPVICLSGRTSTPGWSIFEQQVRDAVVLASPRARCAPARTCTGRVSSGWSRSSGRDHPLSALQLAGGAQRRQIAARAGLAVALAPDVFALDGLADEVVLLPVAAALEQRRGQHLRALTGELRGRAHGAELFADDLGRENVGLLLGASVAARDVPVQIAGVDRGASEAPHLFGGRLRSVCLRRGPLGAEKGAHLLAKSFVLCPVSELHGDAA